MRIQQLTAFQIPIRLKKPVRHASHARTENETLIVRCRLDDGSTGWGEGLPRTYVTGESIDSVWRHLIRTDFSQLADAGPDELAQVVSLLDSLMLAEVAADPGVVTRECFGNAVRCAIDTAVLDAACRAHGMSMGDLLTSLPEFGSVIDQQQEVFYSGAITSALPSRQWISAAKMRLFGFHQVKVKIGATGIDDRRCLERVRRVLGTGVDIRLDANEAWAAADVAPRMQDLLPFRPTSLEQPVPHAQASELAGIRRQLPLPIMLDESLCCQEDAERAVAGGWCDLFNIRLSKCGGLIRSMRLAVYANRQKLGYQLGCQVGETGILSAAGRQFACNVRNIRYLEGSYDRFLVRERLTEEDLTIRRRGLAGRLTGPGLGITVNESRILDTSVRQLQLIPGS